MAHRRSGPAAAAAAAAVLLALLAAAALPATALLTPAQETEWLSYQKTISATAGAATGAALSGAHSFSTPLQGILSSNVYTGGNGRLRRVVADLLAGKAVKVVAIGGVATNGSDASSPGRNDYFAQYVAFLSRAFPAATVTPVRASAGLAPSSVVAGCLDRFLPKDADLVVLEMTASDGATMDASIVAPVQPRAYEILVRKILGAAKKPAVVMLQTMPPGMGNGTRPFYLTPESPAYAAVSGYYNVPYVSMRNALWPSGQLTTNGLLASRAVVAADGSTPNDAGHSALVDSLVMLTQRTAMDLQLLPFGTWDTKQADADVPSKVMFMGSDAQAAALKAAACSWVRNASVSTTGGCPTGVDQLCGLDYSSWAAVKDGYAKSVTETFGDNASSGSSSKMGAIIGGAVGGVVGGLAIIGGIVAFFVVRQKRRAAAEEAAYSSKFSISGLPITAAAGGEANGVNGHAPSSS